MSHYDVLEVSPKASAEVIRAAYKSLMQRHHPDKNANLAESTHKASLIAQAYEVLSDAQRRRAYDETLRTWQTAPWQAEPWQPLHHARRGQALNQAQATRSWGSTPLWSWYAALLILSILVAGGAILVWGKQEASKAPIPQETRPSRLRSAEAPAIKLDSDSLAPRASDASAPGEFGAVAGAITGELQARTIASFVTDLSIELAASDSPQSSAMHVLRIPSIALRVPSTEPDRWIQRIQAQRPQIIKQLLITLSNADYLELIQVDADLYLMRLIGDAVSTALGLDPSAVLAASGEPIGKPAMSVEVVLPLSFSVR